jgi:uncharacterized protein
MPEATEMRVRLQPRASRNAIIGDREGTLIVSVTAPPVGGAANEALRKLLSKRLGVGRGRVEIVRGHRSRDKVIRVAGVGPHQIRAKLGRDLSSSYRIPAETRQSTSRAD